MTTSPQATKGDMASSLGDLKGVLEKLAENNRETRTTATSSYEKRDELITVRMRINVLTIADIDTLKEEFTCEFVLTAKWTEPNIMKQDVDWKKAWDPRITFPNASKIECFDVKRRIGQKPYALREVPDAQLTVRVKGSFKFNTRLADFPFDYQDLIVKLQSDWSDNQVQFVKDMTQKDSIRTDMFSGNQQWKLVEHVASNPVTEKKMETGSKRSYPLYVITMNVIRNSSYYKVIWNVALIMFLITPLSFTSFAVSWEAPEDRISITLTLLLTAVAFKFVVSESIADTCYQTLLEYYLVTCMAFLCLVVVQNASITTLSDEPSARQFDFISMIVLGVIYILVTLIFIAISVSKRRKLDTQMNREIEAFKNRCLEIELASRTADTHQPAEPTENTSCL